MTADDELETPSNQSKELTEVGYKRPPVKSRFKPGQSGNPTGRTKGSKNLKTLFNQILKEEVSLREGSEVRKVSKAEAVLRSVVIGALKGDSRSIGTLFRLAEQTGQFDEPGDRITGIRRIIVSWKDAVEGERAIDSQDASQADEVPGITDISKESE